ncbi:MAG TPA: hypothetical protein VHO67_16375 [Polyangia bacterium]|nr:hypothetical protein [Polyangia bacterium]
MRIAAALVLLSALGVTACAGDTGGELVAFTAYAAGVADETRELDTGLGYHVSLTAARAHVGAVYLRLGQSNPGSANASCVGDTTYGLQVPGPVDVDLLSTTPQPFSVPGSATTDLDQSGEVWLASGDVNVTASRTVVVAVAGTATRSGASYPFAAEITIGANRLIPPANPAAPGTNPICKERIVAPIPLQLQPTPGGHLLLQIDPAPWFDDVDFSTLLPGPDGVTLAIPDASAGSGPDIPAGRAFFMAITSASPDVYRFSWIGP